MALRKSKIKERIVMNPIRKLKGLVAAVILWKMLKLWFTIQLLRLREMKLCWRIFYLNQPNYSTKSQPIN